MSNKTAYPGITVKNFGPFEYASLELRPITILIGRNSVGKSMLTYLVWTLATSLPNFEKLGEIVAERDTDEIADEILDHVNKGINPERRFKEFTKMHIEALPEAIVVSFKESLQRTFMMRPKELVRVGAEKATVRVEGPLATLEMVLEGDDVKVSYYRPYLEFVNEFEVSVPRPGGLKITYSAGREYQGSLTSFSDLVSAVLDAIVDYIISAFGPFFATEEITALFPDSRAGISRVLIKPYTSPRLVRGISYADEQFVSLYYRLAEYVDEGLVDLDRINSLLEELGCTLEVVFEKGAYTVYINTWAGKRLPLSQAPSGIRESLAVALALASKKSPYIVMVEEPEAHLHPRAQKLLAKLITRSVNELKKFVLITTHSDYLLYALNDLIALSQHPERAKKLGFLRSEAIDPGRVAAYLVRAEGKKAILEPLAVGPEGVPEDEFTRVAEELAEERARIVS